MNKSLLALAVLGAFAGAASAQSSVTLYGRVDAGYTVFNPKSGTTTDLTQTSGLAAGVLAGNRFGLRGSESLGGGTSAIFALEAGFALDDGTSSQGIGQLTQRQCQNNTTGVITRGSASTFYLPASACPTGTTEVGNNTTTSASPRLFGRQAYLGLRGDWGSVVLGRLATFSSGTGDFDKIGSLDPFRTGAGTLGWQATMSSLTGLRLDNAVAYLTPNLAGFSAGLGYTFRAIGGGELAGGTSANTTGYTTYVNWGAGPFYVVLTYDQLKLGELDPSTTLPGVPSDPKQKHLQLGASWDFKVVKISGAYAKEQNQYAFGPAGVGFGCSTSVTAGGSCITTQAPGSDADAWALGAIIPFGPHRFNLSYQSRSVDAKTFPAYATNVATSVPKAERTVYSLGYEYSFSRRTTGYFYYGNVSDKDSYKTTNWGGVTQLFLGMNHAF